MSPRSELLSVRETDVFTAFCKSYQSVFYFQIIFWSRFDKSERSELFTKILKISVYLCWEIFIFGTLFLVNCSLKIYLEFWVHFLGKINFCKFCVFGSIFLLQNEGKIHHFLMFSFIFDLQNE